MLQLCETPGVKTFRTYRAIIQFKVTISYLSTIVFAGSPFSIGLEGSLLHSNQPPS